ncbi:MAG: DUF2848 family protein [Planctomycetota bacterium]|nr:DUF2848 family protein [Planctomycetota bacterium]
MNTHTLELHAGGTVRPLAFAVRRMVNAGYTGRDQASVRAHIDELAAQGVPPPASVPLCIPVAARNLTLDDAIEVWPGKNSGEAEVVFWIDGPEIYVGVGSDHTDRDLEAQSIEKSKQICPNVASRAVWRLADVEARWDALRLRSFVAPDLAAPYERCQDAPLAALMPPRALLEYIRARISEPAPRGLVVFSGTVPMLGHPPAHARRFRCELRDEAAGRVLACEYRIEELTAAPAGLER